MTGKPNERHVAPEVFVTFQTVRIVPAAPSCDCTVIADDWLEQRATAGAPEPLGDGDGDGCGDGEWCRLADGLGWTAVEPGIGCFVPKSNARLSPYTPAPIPARTTTTSVAACS